jgi:hypothetical protein
MNQSPGAQTHASSGHPSCTGYSLPSAGLSSKSKDCRLVVSQGFHPVDLRRAEIRSTSIRTSADPDDITAQIGPISVIWLMIGEELSATPNGGYWSRTVDRSQSQLWLTLPASRSSRRERAFDVPGHYSPVSAVSLRRLPIAAPPRRVRRR